MKRFIKAVVIILLIIVLILAGIAIFDRIAKINDNRELRDAYGQRVVLSSGDTVNICEYGDGNKTIVVLPGFGSVSPALEYKGLAMAMPEYHFVIFEPLGYGLSDVTDIPRTSDNICNEIHETLQLLDVNQYTLMAHSISGLYSMNYINKYQNEIDEFIGIDISYPGMEDSETANMVSSLKSANVLNEMGIIRVLSMISADESIMLPQILGFLDENEITLCRKLTYCNSVNINLISEAEHMDANMEQVKDYIFPRDLKVQLYVSGDNCNNVPGWEEGHRNLINECSNGICEVLEGGHYLHLDCTEELAEKIRENTK